MRYPVDRFCPISVRLTMATSQGIESEFCSKMNNSIWYSEKTNERYHAVHEGDCPFAGTYLLLSYCRKLSM